MKIQFAENFEAMSEMATSVILKKVMDKPNLLLCAATGNSTTGLYQNLVAHAKNSSLFHELRVIKLDEWEVPMNNPQTCEAYLLNNLVRPLKIASDNYISINSNATNPEEECKRIQQKLRKQGPIDVCVLGLGMNGHIGFNEPANFLQPFCHVAKLSEKSKTHEMAKLMDMPVNYGMSLGMADILASKQIILLVTGKGKSKIIKQLLTEKITTALPASFLWLHQNAICIIDKTAMN